MNRQVIIGVIAVVLVAAICTAGCTSKSTNSSNNTTTSNATLNKSQSATVNVTTLAPVSVQGGQDFTLQLQSNPSTGYHWQCCFDSNVISLKNQTYVSDQPLTAGVSGVGGKDVFTFQAVKADFSMETLITFANISPGRMVTGLTVCDVTVNNV